MSSKCASDFCSNKIFQNVKPLTLASTDISWYPRYVLSCFIIFMSFLHFPRSHKYWISMSTWYLLQNSSLSDTDGKFVFLNEYPCWRISFSLDKIDGLRINCYRPDFLTLRKASQLRHKLGTCCSKIKMQRLLLSFFL